MNSVYAGTAILTTATFTDPNGVLTDPTTVILKFAVQGQAPTTWTYAASQLTRVSTGVYQATLDTSAGAGTWTVEWIGTGACEVVNAATFAVNSAPL